MSKFCEEARHLIIQLLGHFFRKQGTVSHRKSCCKSCFIVKCHFLSKSHVLAKTKRVLSGIEKAYP